ncbi:zinc-dependent alcohol dehydrogenase [Paenibacillus thalictri]|nr:zinc-binding dehydrogenase [Paenibacillus thalictri]
MDLINKKVVFRAPYSFDIESVPIQRELADNDVLIRTLYSLISPGTELALYSGSHVGINDPNNTFAKFPFYAGYTSVGEIVAVGAKVDRFQIGDQVFTTGKHAKYNIVPAASSAIPLLKLPAQVKAEHAPFVKMAIICMTAVAQSKIRVGDTAVVIGMGLIGNLAAQLYSIMGATVIAADVVESRLQIAKQCGIEHVILSGPDVNLQEQVLELTGGKKADIVVEATGSPKLVVPALDLARQLGQVIALGSTRGMVDLNVYEYIQRKGVHLIGAYEALMSLEGFPSRMTLSRYIFKLIGLGALKIEPLISHILPYEQAEAGYNLLLKEQDKALGVLLDWQNA